MLEALGPEWDMRVATMDDSTGQVAKLFARLPGGGVKQIDFLSAVAGLDTRLARVALDYGLAVTAAIPVARVASPQFRNRRWPPVQAELEKLRLKHSALAARRVATRIRG